MAAKSKPVEEVTVADLGVDVSDWGQSITSVEDAPAREAGEIIEDDGEMYNKIVEFLDNLKVT
jgi:electron transfer flavoprotein beta subunit